LVRAARFLVQNSAQQALGRCPRFTAFLHLGMLAFVPSDQVHLIDLDRARQFRGGGRGYHPFPKLPGQPLGIIFIDAQLVCDLAVAQIQPHQVQPRDPHPQRLMVARKHRAREIVERL
jgi:hypothetical protein